jgi:hypothetical protein
VYNFYWGCCWGSAHTFLSLKGPVLSGGYGRCLNAKV